MSDFWNRLMNKTPDAKKTASAPDKKPPVDLTMILSVTDGDKELEQRILNAFFTEAEKSMETLHLNCVDGQSPTWHGAAHKLKGGAGNMGF